ncbi:MAG: 50S ribosomal protein L19e [Nanoarchaeota archaeon]
MNLEGKKKLAARTLSVGVDRILIDVNRIEEVKEAITRQDIKDLVSSGAIKIKNVNGRRKNTPKVRRRVGKVKLKIKNRKKNYVIMTRKLRRYIKELKNQDKMDSDQYKDIRKKIRNKVFKSKRHLKESLS